MRRLALVVALLLAVGCSSGSDDGSTASDQTIPEAKSTCGEMFAEGRPTDAVLADYEAGPCTLEDGTAYISAIATRSCASGHQLNWLDLGWGASGETWHVFPTTGAKTPPQTALDACNP